MNKMLMNCRVTQYEQVQIRPHNIFWLTLVSEGCSAGLNQTIFSANDSKQRILEIGLVIFIEISALNFFTCLKRNY